MRRFDSTSVVPSGSKTHIVPRVSMALESGYVNFVDTDSRHRAQMPVLSEGIDGRLTSRAGSGMSLYI